MFLLFMKCIGDHMNGSGLHEIWVESDLLGHIAAEQVLSGEHYNRGMWAHKITSQAVETYLDNSSRKLNLDPY
jgi:hypothetical protein